MSEQRTRDSGAVPKRTAPAIPAADAGATEPLRAAARRARRIVVKIGTRVLTGEGGGFDRRVFGALAEALCRLRDSEREIIIVSSGAVGLGMELLGYDARPKDLPGKQAAAALGQALLMSLYEEHFAGHGRHVGQILLTHADVHDRTRFLNARHTLQALLRLGAIPIINENDSVAVEEIMFGDNDSLSALVAGMVGADLLVILSDVEGLYDADPRANPEAQLLHDVPRVEAAHVDASAGTGSEQGTGGMRSKISAVRAAADFGIPSIIARGRRDGVLEAIVAGEPVGTMFGAPERGLSARKVWIGHARRVAGTLLLDAGAAQAVGERGKSLLPAGILEVQGEFEAGALVVLQAPSGEECGRGLVGYNSEQCRRLAGHQVSEIETLLGFRKTDEIIHRDDLVVRRS